MVVNSVDVVDSFTFCVLACWLIGLWADASVGVWLVQLFGVLVCLFWVLVCVIVVFGFVMFVVWFGVWLLCVVVIVNCLLIP